MPSRTPLKPATPPFIAQWPFEDTSAQAKSPVPAFVSAADALRAKIRACAARSFAAQQKWAAGKADLRADLKTGSGEKSQTAMAAGRGARKLGPDGPRAHS